MSMDNDSVPKLTKNPEFHGRSKHIGLRYHVIRERIQAGDIVSQWIETRLNVTDILTKSLPRPTFQFLVERLGMNRVVYESTTMEDSEEKSENKFMSAKE